MQNNIKWTEDFAVGIEQIDMQHKKFFELMNALLELSIKGEYNEKIPHSIDMLKTYARYHFSLEEELMLLSGYPKYKEHIAAHRFFKDELFKIEPMIKDPNITSNVFIKKYNFMLVEWFNKHIKIMDKKMSEHLNQYKEEHKSFLEKMTEILSKPFGTS